MQSIFHPVPDAEGVASGKTLKRPPSKDFGVSVKSLSAAGSDSAGWRMADAVTWIGLGQGGIEVLSRGCCL